MKIAVVDISIAAMYKLLAAGAIVKYTVERHSVVF